MTSIIKVDTLQDTGGNTILSSNGTGTFTSSLPTPSSLSTASGSAPSYSARAWVNFDATGTPAIRASGNVSSITDNGTGDFTINFTTALPDGNFAVGYFVGDGSSTQSAMTTAYGGTSAMTTTSFRFRSCFNNSGSDAPYDYPMTTFIIMR